MLLKKLFRKKNNGRNDVREDEVDDKVTKRLKEAKKDDLIKILQTRTLKQFRYFDGIQRFLYFVFTAIFFGSIFTFGGRLIDVPLLIAFISLSISHLSLIENQVESRIRDHLTFEK